MITYRMDSMPFSREIALPFVTVKLSVLAVNGALTLMSILLKLACISISRPIESVIVRERKRSRPDVCGFICRFVFLPVNLPWIALGTGRPVNLEIMTEVTNFLSNSLAMIVINVDVPFNENKRF